MTPMPQSPRRSRLPALLAASAAGVWLLLLFSIVALIRPGGADQANGALPEVLPRFQHSLQLPYFSFARALRPGS